MPWYEVLKDLLFNRYPIKASIGIDKLDKPTIVISISNQTPSNPVIIHSVRVHFGNLDFSRAFVLHPREKFNLASKDEAHWKLLFENSKTCIQERTRSKAPPLNHNPKAQPGIESPAQLFNAIGMGNAIDSWVEVDFNEYKDRRFLRGKVKRMFDIVGQQHRELRKQQRTD